MYIFTSNFDLFFPHYIKYHAGNLPISDLAEDRKAQRKKDKNSRTENVSSFLSKTAAMKVINKKLNKNNNFNRCRNYFLCNDISLTVNITIMH